MPRQRPALIGIVALAMAAGWTPAHAARFTGDYLLQLCGSDLEGREIIAGGHAVCQAYIAGIIDYHSILKSMGSAPGVDFCVPEGEGLYKIQSKVQSYVFRTRSQHEDFIAAPGVAMALYLGYPCGKRR